MKIAHVVTYVSPDGAFGGPVRVALGQAAALAERGHEVTVYAASPPQLAGTIEESGYTLRTFAAKRLSSRGGFASMTSWQLTRALRQDLRSIDVAHVHLARDLVTIPAARAIQSAGVPFVLQPHGMIDATDRLLAKPLDFVATRPLLRSARLVLVLTDREALDVREIEPRANIQRIGNGVKVGAVPTYSGRDNVVLYLARLHQRKRPFAFVKMAEILKDELPETQFILVGSDAGEGQAVLNAINESGLSSRVKWRGALAPEQTQTLLSSVLAYVLPAVDEVFPMTILESFQAGTPVVTTDSLGIASTCERYGAAMITDGSPAQLAEAVRRVLADTTLADRLRLGGSKYLREELDVSAVAGQLESIYQRATTP